MLIIQWGRNPIMVTNKSFIPKHYKQKDRKNTKPKTSPPYALVAAMTSMQTYNFETLKLTNTLETFLKHF